MSFYLFEQLRVNDELELRSIECIYAGGLNKDLSSSNRFNIAMSGEQVEQTSGKERVIGLLRTGSYRHADIVKRTGLKPPTVTYHLQKLNILGIVRQNKETKTYELTDEQALELKILNMLKGKQTTIKEIVGSPEAKAYNANEIATAIEKLKIRGFIEDAAFLRIHKGGEEIKYKLSLLGALRLGVCYVCNDELKDGFAIEAFIHERFLSQSSVVGASIHAKCVAKLMSDRSDLILTSDDTCQICGLPLSIKFFVDLIRSSDVPFMEFYAHLSNMERMAYFLREDSHKRLDLKRGFGYVGSLGDIEDLVREIQEGAKANDIDLGDYSTKERIKEFYDLWREMLAERQKKVERLTELLFGPYSVYQSLNSHIIWDTEQKYYREIEIDGKQGYEPVDVIGIDLSPIVIINDRKAHPYCVIMPDKLGKYEQSKAGGKKP